MEASRTTNELLIRYEGLDADKGKANIGHLGESLIGLYRLLNFGFHLLGSDSMPASRPPKFITVETRI